MKEADVSEVLRGFQAMGAFLGPPLTDAEVRRVEECSGVRIPNDLRLVLRRNVPVGTGFHNWHSVTVVDDFASFVLNEIWFDVRNGVFWLDDWGTRPSVVTEDHIVLLKASLDGAPKLLPIYQHRCMPAYLETANPVLSLHQTDIIYYGADLVEYVRNDSTGKYDVSYGRIDPVPFWTQTFID